MNLSLYTVALFTTSFFVTKQIDTLYPERETITAPAPAAAYSTGWETVSDWQLVQSNGEQVYTYNRSTPELDDAILNGGAVVVFAKGYDFEGFSKQKEKPLGLPFYMMTLSETISRPYSWYSENSKGNIKVGLEMSKEGEGNFKQASSGIQLRYFVLPKNFLEQHHLTKLSLRSLSYIQLTQLLGVAQ